MRHLPIACWALLLLAGCNLLKPANNGGSDVREVRGAAPSAEVLVNYLNDNARRIQSLDCGSLSIDAKAKGEGISLPDCWLVCSKPRNFRMSARAVGSQEVDMGSNESEFWWWIKHGDPYLFHCSYEDMSTKQVRMPFPFQPDWIMEGLGMAEYGPAANFTVNQTKDSVELIEQSKSASGQPVRKVTVFGRNARGTGLTVTAHLLQDGNGKLICAAYVDQAEPDARTNAMVPSKLRLWWPQEQTELKMTLHKVAINDQIDQQRAARLFTRPQLTGVQTYNLATGPEQGQAIRRASGTEMPAR